MSISSLILHVISHKASHTKSHVRRFISLIQLYWSQSLKSHSVYLRRVFAPSAVLQVDSGPWFSFPPCHCVTSPLHASRLFAAAATSSSLLMVNLNEAFMDEVLSDLCRQTRRWLCGWDLCMMICLQLSEICEQTADHTRCLNLCKHL